MTRYPNITEFLPEKERGRDFMGQQATIQAMTGYCIPSFTNSTAKLRYYTFWAWAFKMLKNNFKQIEQGKHQQYLWKLETALNITNRLRDPEYKGMPGVNGITFPNFDSPDDLQVVIDLENDSRTSSYSPVQYAPSLGTLNIVRRESANFLLLKYGTRLASIFDDEIKTYDGYAELLDPNQKTLSMLQLKNLIPPFSLEKVTQEEKDCFLEIIEQDEFNNGSTHGVTPRTQTTLMLLDIIQKQLVYDTQGLIQPIWSGEYKSPEALAPISSAWRIIRARQYFQLSLESYLSSFCLYIEAQPSTEGSLNGFIKQILQKIPTQQILNFQKGSIQKLIEESKNFGDFSESLYGLSQELGIDEGQVQSAIEGLRVKHAGAYNIHLFQEMAMLGFIMQVLLFVKLESLKSNADKNSELFLTLPGGYRLSFNSFKQLFGNCRELSLEEGMERLLSESMLKLHLGVAQDKWLQTGNFTFRFVRADNGGYMRQHESGINNPNATGNKLWAYVSMLRYIGLWEYGDDKQMLLTEEGINYLSQKVELIN